MEPLTPALPPRDDDFPPPAPPRRIAFDPAPESYLRLFANPFLGFLGYIALLGLLIASVRRIDDLNNPWLPPAALVFVLILFQVPKLFQYHCLDCGATGRLTRWRQHLCPVSDHRRHTSPRRLLRGPSPPVQVMIWLWVLLASAVVLVPRAFLP